MERILSFLEHVGGAISLVGVLVIVGGFALASVQYVTGYRRLGAEADFKRFKVSLGHALMLGLEILVVADVIETIEHGIFPGREEDGEVLRFVFADTGPVVGQSGGRTLDEVGMLIERLETDAGFVDGRFRSSCHHKYGRAWLKKRP